MPDSKSFADSFGGGLISGAAGSLINGLFNIGAAKRQFEYQSKLQEQQYELNEKAADAAYERQKDFYNIQNAWNDPSAIRKRYENAKINPTSAFGTAGSYTPAQQAATAPQGSGAGLGTASAFPVTDPIEQAYRLAMIRNVDADTKKKENETPDHDETLRGQRLANDLMEAGLISQQIANKIAALDLQFKNEVYDTEVAIRKQTADNMAKQCELMNQEIAKSISDIEVNEEQKKQLQSLVLLNNANAAFAQARANWHGKISKAQIEQYQQFTRNLEGENKKLAVEVANEYLKGSGLEFENKLKQLAVDWTNPEKGVKISSEVVGMLKDIAIGIFMGKRTFR